MTAELFRHLWQSTVFSAAVALLTLAFQRSPARIRYWLWLSASIKFLAPFAILIGLGSALRTWAPADRMSTEIAARIAAPAASRAMEQLALPRFPVALPAPAAGEEARWIPSAVLSVWLCGFAAVALVRLENWRASRRA